MIFCYYLLYHDIAGTAVTHSRQLQLSEKSAHLYEKWHDLQSLFVPILALGLNKFLAFVSNTVRLQKPSTVNGANN
jgi:hypothetical protein